MAAVMYRHSEGVATQNAPTHSHLLCGRQFSGNGRQVSKLIDLHRRVCKECANETDSQKICIGYEKQTYSGDSHIWNVSKISASIEQQIASMPSMSELDRAYNRSFAEYATKDCLFNSDMWATLGTRTERMQLLRNRHEAWFRQMVNRSRKK